MTVLTRQDRDTARGHQHRRRHVPRKKLIDPKEKSFLEQLRGNWGVITHDISAPTNGHRRLVNTRSTSGEWPMASGS